MFFGPNGFTSVAVRRSKAVWSIVSSFTFDNIPVKSNCSVWSHKHVISLLHLSVVDAIHFTDIFHPIWTEIARRKQMGMQWTRLLFPVDKKMESYVKNLKGELSCSTRTRRTVPPTPPPLPLPLSVHKVSQNWHIFVTLAKVWLLFFSFLYILRNTAHVIDTQKLKLF